MNKSRVYIAARPSEFRRRIAERLRRESDIRLVGESGDGSRIMEAIWRLRPDLVLMDSELSGLSGLDATRHIGDALPDVSVVIFAEDDRQDSLLRALAAGASGCLLAEPTVDDVMRALRLVLSGGMVIHPRAGAVPAADGVGGPESQWDDQYALLSAREREVLPMVADGLTHREVAERMRLSPLTVQTYRQRIMKKLDLHKKTDLLRFALSRGLVRL